MSNHQERVSPWEIDSSVSLPPLSIQSSPRLKKLRTSQQAPSVLDSHFAGTDLTFLNPFVLCCHYVVSVLHWTVFILEPTVCWKEVSLLRSVYTYTLPSQILHRVYSCCCHYFVITLKFGFFSRFCYFIRRECSFRL